MYCWRRLDLFSGVIDPRDTRTVVARCLRACYDGAPLLDKYGVFRM